MHDDVLFCVINRVVGGVLGVVLRDEVVSYLSIV